MRRREFIASSIAASGAVLSNVATAQTSASSGREYYQLRKYFLSSGPQQKLASSYFADALIPALNRMGFPAIGVFSLDIGPETPTLYVLIPATDLQKLVTVDLLLAKDEAFLKAAAPFWSAPATANAFNRVESSLMIAFAGHPKLTVPASVAQKTKRIFQLRQYESPSYADHIRKVEMFHDGEFDIFTKAGFKQVFYADTLVGARLPNLTYMLTFADMAELETQWNTFRNDPDWKKLSGSPKYAYEQIVSNITNLILSPAPYSQI